MYIYKEFYCLINSIVPAKQIKEKKIINTVKIINFSLHLESKIIFEF